MASPGHDFAGGENQPVNRRLSNGQQQQQPPPQQQPLLQHVTDQSQTDNIRSWLDSTSPSIPPLPWNNNAANLDEPRSSSTTTHAESTAVVEGGEYPPPYREIDPAKDYPSTHEFELDENNKSNFKLYTPFFLRTWVFVAFAFTFAAMLIAVEVMYQFANRGHGLRTLDPDLHYLWTFGPTLFLTIVACLWGRVEYWVKQLMPWKAMTKGPVPADKVLLIDYVSPWNVSALVTAIKERHIVVALAIIGTLLIKFAIIFSAGLLSLGSQRVFEPGTLVQLKDTFETFGTSANSSYIQPVITVLAASQYGLALPPGTTDHYAAQSFEAVETITDESSVLLADVYVLSADMICQTGVITDVSAAQCAGSDPESSCDIVSYNITVSSNDCTTNSSQISVSVDDASDQYYGSVSLDYCKGKRDEQRLTFLSGHQVIGYSGGASNASHSTAQICKPQYVICKSPVSIFLNGTIDRVSQINSSCSSIPNISSMDLAVAVLDMVEYASMSYATLFDKPGEAYNGSFVNLDPFFQLMNATARPSNITQFNNGTYLEDSVRNLFASLAAQLAKTALMMPTTQRVDGVVIAYQQRLFVREISLRLLESIFASLIAIALVTLLLRPHHSTPCDASTPAGIASILARSHRATSALHGLGSSRPQQLKERLTGKTCHTVISTDGDPAYGLVIGCTGNITPASSFREETRWWQPFAMSVYSRIGLVLLPLALIATLEAVYQFSKDHRGLADVNEFGHSFYAWTFVPATVTILSQFGYQKVDFYTRLFQPYRTLRQSPSPADRTILVNYLSQMTPRTIWQAFVRKHYAVMLTGLVMLMVPLLTVVVSGLYIPGYVENIVPSSIGLNDTIDNTLAWNKSESSSSMLASTVATLLVEANTSYPAWTYGRYVVPKLSTDAFLKSEAGADSMSNTTTVRVELSAYSAAMNCQYAVPSVLPLLIGTDMSYAHVQVPVPKGCGDQPGFDTLHLGDLALREGFSDYGMTYVSLNASLPAHCPQTAFVYGRGRVDSLHGQSDLELSAAVCSPTVYRVKTNTTFVMPGFSIRSIKPDFSTMETITKGGAGNATLNIADWLPPTSWNVDPFYGGLVPGRRGVTWTDLLDVQNFANFSSAVDELYGIIYSQWLNIYGRAEPPADAEILDALIMDPQRMRLQQSAVSTRILEGLLAAITICIVTAWFLLDTRKLLPMNPCSIGAMSSLLVDSEILCNIPEGVEWYGRKELQNKRIFSDYLFSLDWFEGSGTTKKYGIDIGNGEIGNSNSDD